MNPCSQALTGHIVIPKRPVCFETEAGVYDELSTLIGCEADYIEGGGEITLITCDDL